MRWIKNIALIGAGGCLFAIVLLAGLLFYQATTPVSDKPERVIFDIPPGLTLKQISVRLAQQKLIPSASAFRILAYLKNQQNLVKVGEYALSPTQLPSQILDQLTSGKAILYSITIPEGYRITEIDNLLKQSRLVKDDEFIRHTQDPQLIRQWAIPTRSLEGYLFPETYNFSRYTGAQKIVETLLDTFKDRVLKKEYLDRARALGFTFHEIVTLASLIEKETGVDEERKLISSVFHNRLKKRMRLQTDPSVIYALEEFDGNIRKRDLFVDSPYNTYRYSGLPPGPIANPGLKSVIAALFPVRTNHLYFVSKQDGSHYFSSTLEEHNRAVKKYQLQRVNRAGNN
ncbi:MAG: aminodeoxychorismate lyase [Nitrospinae bacterium CG11_big_fil_rev_8_21_14_0_20_56_8]|nr:MAG: aminodeoxychorismate lyase [Nitrospinae bacterium CG11_big_fil_rev_8_21_14_0_20_56_8]